MTATIRGMRVYPSLSVVYLTGFEPETEVIDGYKVPVDGDMIDPPGSANWLCERWGQTDSPGDHDADAILWTDYQVGGDWDFSALIATENADALADFAREAGYTVGRIDPITEPTNYGDGNGTVEILKHRDGWVILEN
jgi:hypothetical protein